MAASPFPAAVKLNYHSDFGIHSALIPTLDWNPTTESFDIWSGGETPDGLMIQALVNVLVPFFTADVVFDDFIIYTYDTPTSPARPRKSANLGTVGTNPSTAWHKATQATWTFRTTEFGISKLVLLDCATEGNFDKITDASGITAVQDLIDEFTDENNGWSGRDNARPEQWVQIAYTLNEKLRRAYRMN